MTNEHDLEKGRHGQDQQEDSSSSSEESTSSTASTSPPSSVPSDSPPQYVAEAVEPEPEALPRIHHAPHSSTPPRRGRRAPRASPLTRLGVIDEDSNAVAPDIPTRNPNRKLGGMYSAAKFFGLGSAWASRDADVPPPGVYDNIVGPRGEKFTDLRKNKTTPLPPKRLRRKWLWVALAILVVIAIALGVGLGVGLTRKKKNTENIPSGGNTEPSSSDPEPFPLGTHSIPTYLITANTNCTSNAATWRCYPYSTYSSADTAASFSTLQWRISSPTNSTLDLQISNTDPTFSYPFSNLPLQLSNSNDVHLSSFTFSYPYRKQVIPNGDITGDGAATRCYYNNTVLSVWLYNNPDGAGGNVVEPPAGQTNIGITPWPYAIEYEERINEAPECFRYHDGEETDPVEVTAGTGDCICGYRNYGLS